MSKIIIPEKPKLKKSHISLDLWYEMSVHDLNTGKRTRYRKGRCYSFVGNFVKLLNGLAAGPGRRHDFTSVDGVARTTTDGLYSRYTWSGRLDAPATTHQYGIQVGTGTTAPTINDYQLATKILHGTSSGQLQYSAVTFGAPATVVGLTTFVATRVFTNGSGGDITVKEIGMVFGSMNNAQGDNMLMARDTVADTLVPNGQALTLNYTFRTDV